VAPTLIARRRNFQRTLLEWYRREARPLPWRQSPSLYKTVVSEFMLQQTQVKTALPYFNRWLEVLPDFARLATATEAGVLKLWEGLGYYSRARNLHRLARELHSRRSPPHTPSEWLELPGVGPYTAAAITSIAFGAPAACVDGNVVRILARLTGEGRMFRDSATAAQHFRPLAQALLPASEPGDHNQAMMELGATICLRSKPSCPECPVRRFCAAARTDQPGAIPRFAPKQIENRAVTRIWCERDGALLLHRAPATARRLANQHELPLAEHAGLAPDVATTGNLLSLRQRSITRFRITESIHRVAPSRKKLGPDLVWVPLAALDSITLSGPHRRWVAEILARRAKASPRSTPN